jgi:tetratricopeptide (TPR) repeat protein
LDKKEENTEFHELAKIFKKPSLSTPEPEYLISSEETPFIRRFEDQELHNLSDHQIEKLDKWRDLYLKFIKTIGCDSKMEVFNVKSLTKLANYLYHIEDSESSQYVFDIILNEFPEDVRSLHNKALCIAKQGKVKDALKLISLAIEKYPEYYDALYNKASFLSELGEYQEGIDILELLLTKFPFHERAILESLVNSYAHVSNLEKANFYYKVAEEKKIVSTLIKLNLATAYFNAGDFAESLTIYEKILEDEPKNYQATINRISCLLQLNYNHTASTILERLKRELPSNTDIYQHLVMVNVSLNNPSLAIALAEKAICLGTTDYLIYNYIGLSYSSLGDYEEGIRNYDRAISINKQCYQALGNKSNNLISLKKLKEAVQTMRLFLEYRPNEETILHNIQSVENEILKRNEWPEEFRQNHF